MKYFSFTGSTFEHEIIGDLRSTGIDKRKAEEHLFVKYSYLIANGVRKYLICEDDSFNAYSDTVLDVIHAVTTGVFEGRSSLKTYLHRVFYNKCVDITRKRAAKKNIFRGTIQIETLEPYLSDTSISIVEKLIMESEMEALKEKMNQLSDTQRKLLMLSAKGYTDKEIATAMMFKSIDVVKVTRLRCIKKLRRMLNEKEKVAYED